MQRPNRNWLNKKPGASFGRADINVSLAALVSASEPLIAMAASVIAARNGRRSSQAKLAAANTNALKGGRPRKVIVATESGETSLALIQESPRKRSLQTKQSCARRWSFTKLHETGAVIPFAAAFNHRRFKRFRTTAAFPVRQTGCPHPGWLFMVQGCVRDTQQRNAD